MPDDQGQGQGQGHDTMVSTNYSHILTKKPHPLINYV